MKKKPPQVISFVARASESGKTTLIEKIVAILKARGFRVAVIKHTSEGFDLDKPGKDSCRFRQAGADAVVLAGPGEIALIRKSVQDPDTGELERLAGDVDIVLYEGFKGRAQNKVEVFRQGVSGELPLCMGDDTILALVSDTAFEVPIPCFDLNDAKGVSDFMVVRIAHEKERSG